MQRRNFISGLALAGMAAPIAAGAQTKPRETTVALGSFRGVLVKPAGNDLHAGVLLQPTIAAVDGYMRTVATELSTLGYTVLIWDPYGGEPAPIGTAAQLARSKRIRDEDAMRELRRGVDHLTGALKCGSVATLGWCLGGRFALVHAGLDQRVGGVAVFNPTIYATQPVSLYGVPTSRADFPGQTLDEYALFERIGADVQVFRPGHDLAQPAEYRRLEDALMKRPAMTQMSYFPKAEHGFSYRLDKPENRAANALAWPMTLTMLSATRVGRSVRT